jgi:hypothetical protein
LTSIYTRFGVDGAYRALVAEMLQTKAAALATLHFYIEDETAQISFFMRPSVTIFERHRGYLAFLERTLPAAGEGRARGAARLCRLLGAMESSSGEMDAEGLTPLMRAAADGAGPRVLRCLAAAGAEVDAREAAHGNTALRLAAANGHAAAVEELRRLGGDVDAANKGGNTSVYIAACNGHLEVVETLGRLGADVNRASDAEGGPGRTPMYMAAQNGHAAVIAALGRLKADVDRAWNGRSPMTVAALKGHASAVGALAALGGDANRADSE